MTSDYLQSALERSLRRRFRGYGSPEYALTWSYWDMPSGAPICALRASARRTSASAYGGWPSPKASNTTGAGTRGKGGENLQTVALYAGWNTPRATDGKNGGPNQAGGALPADAARAGWCTPTVNDTKGSAYSYGRGKHDSPCLKLPGQAQMAGWATPQARDAKSESASPEFNAQRNTQPRGKPLSYQVTLGQTPSGSPAPTAKRGALNPALSRWLMGYPGAWDCCGATAIALCRNSRRRS